MESPRSLPEAAQIANARLLKWLGGAWMLMGILLIVGFFCPNFMVANLGISGLGVIERAFRAGGNPMRILDDATYCMMVACPIVHLLLGVLAIACGAVNLGASSGKNVVWLTSFSLFAIAFTLVGAWLIDASRSDVFPIAKLLPRTAAAYWMSIGLESLIFVLGMVFWGWSMRGAAKSL